MDALLALLAKVEQAGGRIRLAGGRLELVRGSAGNQKDLDALLPELKAAKPDLDRHFQAEGAGTPASPEHPGRWCEVCEALVFTDSPEVFRLCMMTQCPSWKPGCGVGPDYLAQERNMLAYRERTAQERKERKRSA